MVINPEPEMEPPKQNFMELCILASSTENLINATVDVNERDEDGNTPLMTTTRWNKNPKITEFLINAGADVNARNHHGDTPLMAVCEGPYEYTTAYEFEFEYENYGERFPIIKLLLDNGADPDLKNNNGKKALDLLRRDFRKEYLETRPEYHLLVNKTTNPDENLPNSEDDDILREVINRIPLLIIDDTEE